QSGPRSPEICLIPSTALTVPHIVVVEREARWAQPVKAAGQIREVRDQADALRDRMPLRKVAPRAGCPETSSERWLRRSELVEPKVRRDLAASRAFRMGRTRAEQAHELLFDAQTRELRTFGGAPRC